MLKRIITAAVAIPIGILILVLDNPHIIAAVISFFSVVSVYEILSATKYIQHKSISAISLIFALGLPLYLCYNKFENAVGIVAFVFIAAMFCAMLFNHKKVTFEEMTFIGFISICVPVAFSTLALFRFHYIEHGIFFIVFSLAVTWIADAGAYFAGTFLGKHKLCPEISPKKTWEGFFGGVLSAGIFAVLLGYGYQLWDRIFTGENHFTVNVIVLIITGLIGAVLGVLGDLSASLLKRKCGVKDFGDLLPGHGGVMDRFDSVLFVAPFIYLVFQIFFPISQ